MFLLSLDQSTSATKAVLIDAKQGIIDRESLSHQQHYPQPGWVEHDAEEIWRNTLGTLRNLIARHADKISRIECLSLTNQRETIVLFDRETGKPLHPAIVWQCRRGEALCRQKSTDHSELLVRAKTGLKIDPYFSASKITWLIQNVPDLREKIRDGSAVVGTIDSYLIHRLTFGKVFATDTTNASRTLLFDIKRLCWDEELCQLWGIPAHALPEVRDSTAGFGITNLDGFLTKPIPIRGVLGDSHASLLAHGCTEPGEAKVTFGTGSSILMNIGSCPQFSTTGVLTTLAWTHAGVPVYAFEGIIVSSASTLTWLRDQLGIASEVAQLEQLAKEVEDNEGVYLVPAFSGLGLPYWRPEARALLMGLSAQSDRRHVARAAFESIAYQLRAALESMSQEAGAKLAQLRADGGPTVSAFLMQFCADLAQVNLVTAAAADMSALGAAKAGLLGRAAGDVSTPGLPKGDGILYRPSMPQERVLSLTSGWDHAVRLATTSRIV